MTAARGNRTATLKGTATFSRAVGFPNNRIAEHRYFETFVLNPGLDQPASNIFSMTNIAYPNYSDATNGVPTFNATGFAEWSSFYEKYLVIGATARITWSFSSTSIQGDPQLVIAQLNDVPPILPDTDTIEQAIQNRACKYRMIQSAVNGTQHTMVLKYDAKRWHSLTDVADADNLQSTAQNVGNNTNRISGGNPNDPVYLTCASVSSNRAADGNGVNVSIMITYEVLWSDNIVLQHTQSAPIPP